ncbi:MAG: M64 family metallopeptidase [bacterium]
MRRAITTVTGLLILSCGPAPGPKPPTPTPVERMREPPPQRRLAKRPVKVVYGRFFDVLTLRIDLDHRGSATEERYVVRGLVREGVWAGSQTKLLDPFPYGAHKFEIRDEATGSLLYSRGYSSLFGEWQTTREAKHSSKGFAESVRLPLPRAPFELRIYSRRGGKLVPVLKTTLDPRGPKVQVWTPTPGARTTTLHKSGPLDQRLDILIIGDGYVAAEAEKFHRDARRFADIMLGDSAFGRYKKRYNIRALFVPSKDSGVSEPRKGRNLNTPVGLSFNTLGSPRYMMTTADRALRNVAANAPYDALYLLGNTSRYGGGGIYNLYSTFPSDNEYDEYVFIHEFGHSFAGLADEYFTSPTSTDGMYKPTEEPADPNITAFLKGRFKWKKLVTPGTPIPTPPLPKYRAAVGLFEGAGYRPKGLYRSQLDCKMKGKGHVSFCKVCAAAIARMIELYSE